MTNEQITKLIESCVESKSNITEREMMSINSDKFKALEILKKIANGISKNIRVSSDCEGGASVFKNEE
ncbi:hypothetical protein ACP6L2_03875 [Sphingobacterium lactis]|uniref:hypothetical protein n=1 Tax=Sphingobacterium lactis TaxID=797291 RepID=UPI003F80DE15